MVREVTENLTVAPEIQCGDERNFQRDDHQCNTPLIWALCGQTEASCLQETRHQSSPTHNHPNSEDYATASGLMENSTLSTDGSPSSQERQKIPKSRCAKSERVSNTCVLKSVLVIICNVSQHPAGGALHL